MPMLITLRIGFPVCPCQSPERTRSAKRGHPIEDLVDLRDDVDAVDDQRLALRHPQRDVEHGPVLGDVDPLAPEHRVDPLLEPRLLGEPQEQTDRLVGDPVLRVVEVQAGGGPSGVRRIHAGHRAAVSQVVGDLVYAEGINTVVINSDSGSYRCGDTSANRCRRRAAVKADRVEEIVLDAVRAYSATADAPRRASRRRQIREADEAIERASAELDDTIRQLGELGLLGRAASQETLEKLANTLDDAHAVRARLGDGGQSNIIGPDDIDRPREPAKRLAAWRRLITDTVESVTVAPAVTADGRPSRLWDPSRIEIRFLGQHP